MQQSEAQVEVGARFWNRLALEAQEGAAGHTHTRTRTRWQATEQSQGPSGAWSDPPENSVLAVTRIEESHGQLPESRKPMGHVWSQERLRRCVARQRTGTRMAGKAPSSSERSKLDQGLGPGLRDAGRARQPVAVNIQEPWHTSKVKRGVGKVDGQVGRAYEQCSESARRICHKPERLLKT
jgi:hypothetical protein